MFDEIIFLKVNLEKKSKIKVNLVPTIMTNPEFNRCVSFQCAIYSDNRRLQVFINIAFKLWKR